MSEYMRTELEKPYARIQDAANQLIQFGLFKDIEQVKKLVAETNLKTLEEYTNKTTAELELVKPGVCARYNELIVELKNPDLSFERFKGMIEEMAVITR